MIDLRISELHEGDPRKCVFTDERHDWDYTGTHCVNCRVTPDQVRDRFRDWRYEQLIGKVTDALRGRDIARLLDIAEKADDLVRQRADGLEDIFEDNFIRLADALGVQLTDHD